MLARFLQFIKKHALFNASDKLLVAVSGGVDSMALCELLKQGQFNFCIAHVNFQLRGESSDGDADFVRIYAEENNLVFFENSFETADKAYTEGVSIQMAARDLRYQWFSELIKEHGFDYLLTAHHLNDTAETLLMNVVRGTSIHGLKGIDFKSDKLRRPLSNFNKKELVTFARTEKLPWREDASNLDNKYVRNAIRNEVVPHLENLNTGFLSHIEQLTEKNRVVEQVWNSHVRQLREKLLVEKGKQVLIVKAPFSKGELSAFELFELIVSFGFNYEQAKSIIDSMDTIGAQFLAPDHLLFIERESIAIKKKEDEFDAVILVGELDKKVLFENSSLAFEHVDVPESFQKGIEYFDLAKLTFPLQLRKWKQGDRMKPLGMNGSKLISDILIDKKVDASKKSEVYVLVSADKICWLVGYQIAQSFRVNQATEKALRVSLRSTD